MTRLDMHVLLVFNIISYIGKNAFELSYLKNKKALQFKESFRKVKTKHSKLQIRSVYLLLVNNPNATKWAADR